MAPLLTTTCQLPSILLLLLLLVASSSQQPEGPDDERNWNHPNCKTGKRQSPIDIPANLEKVTKFLPLELNGYDKKVNGTVENLGHSVEFKLIPEESVTLQKGDLPGNYKLVQLHFHWGHKDNRVNGSEHSFNGVYYPLDAHFVHYNTKYKTITEGLNDPDGVGLAVVSITFKIADKPNAKIQPFIESLKDVSQTDDKTPLSLTLRDFFPSNINNFYRYNGSLTTPNCTEEVDWTIFKTHVEIASSQIDEFYKLKSKSGGEIKDNFRGPQPINGRKVIEYGNENGDEDQPTSGGEFLRPSLLKFPQAVSFGLLSFVFFCKGKKSC